MQGLYETSDFHLAATLNALGFKLLSVDRSDYRRSIFQFQDDPQINQVIEAFFRDELALNPRVVLLSAKLVKDRLHAGA